MTRWLLNAQEHPLTEDSSALWLLYRAALTSSGPAPAAAVDATAQPTEEGR